MPPKTKRPLFGLQVLSAYGDVVIQSPRQIPKDPEILEAVVKRLLSRLYGVAPTDALLADWILQGIAGFEAEGLLLES